jgi:hypothetical protein
VYAIAAVMVMAYVVFNTRLVEMFLTFAFGGVVPGTDMVLAPETVMLLMIGLAVCTVLLATLKLAITRARKRRHLHRTMTLATKASSVAIGMPSVEKTGHQAPMYIAEPAAVAPEAPTASERLATDTSIPRFTIGALRMRHITAAFGRRIADIGAIAGLAARFVSMTVLTLGRIIAAATTSGAISTFSFVRASAKVAWRSIVRATAAMWQWAEPRLLKFDEWLELQVRRAESWATRKFQSSPTARSFMIMAREYWKSVVALSFRLAFKPVPKVARKSSKSRSTVSSK